MSKFCGKCGGQLDNKTGLCPNCEAEKFAEMQRKDAFNGTQRQFNSTDDKQPKLTRKQIKAIKKENRTTTQKVRSVLVKVLAVLLAVLVLISGVSILLAYNHMIGIPVISGLFKKNDESNSGSSDYIHYDGDFSGKTIENENKAPEAIKDLSEKLGYKNALDELTVNSSNVYENSHFYRLQENYKNIPIYKRTIVAVTDDKGNIIEISGNVTDIPTDTTVNPNVTQETVNNNAKEYFDKEFGYETEFFEIQKIEEIHF